MPRACSISAAVRPPMPPPTMMAFMPRLLTTRTAYCAVPKGLRQPSANCMVNARAAAALTGGWSRALRLNELCPFRRLFAHHAAEIGRRTGKHNSARLIETGLHRPVGESVIDLAVEPVD